MELIRLNINYVLNHHMRIILFLLLFICIKINAQTIILSGKITDEKNQGLPFASVMIKGTSLGTNANADGYYTLKVEPGKYQIIFQFIGYKKKTEEIAISENQSFNIQLTPESYELKEVVISNGEDPAYEVIRQAIKKRKHYLKEVDAFSCKAYIKGLQRLIEYPKSLAKLINMQIPDGEQKLDSSALGVIYLSESETKYFFKRPNEEKEIMFSSRVSGNNKAFSFNQVSDMKFNLYENLVDLNGLSDRPFISPINENAFLSYRYKLLGTTFEDGIMINKIEVIPKRKTDPCFRGIIYIQENTWRIHSSELYIPKEAKIDFVDTLRISQLNTPVKGDIWMPVNMNMSFTFKIFGFRGDGYFNAIFSDYEINPVFPKKFFKNEVLKVEDDANKKDSAYWQQNRPVPLTSEEKNDYKKKDSIADIRNSPQYKDSVDRKFNKFKFNHLITGYAYRNSNKNFTLNTSGLLSSGVQYNTVEGVNASIKLAIKKEFEDRRHYDISGYSRYGFSNYLWGGSGQFYYLKTPEKFESIQISAGSLAQQFNSSDPINPSINSYYTLFKNDNFLKLYKSTWTSFQYKRELLNGLIAIFKTEYAERQSLKNSANYLWIDDKHKLFTSNDPLRPNTDDSTFTVNNAFTIELGLSIRFKQKYYTKPHQKVIVGSKFPTIKLRYKKAIPTLQSTANYDLAMASVEDDIKLGLLGTFAYRINGGYYLSNKTMCFVDYKHFNGNRTILANNDYLNAFKLLPYYTYSTQKWYTEIHAEHHFNGFIFNKIPVLKKSRMQEVVGGHALFNDKINQYYEVNFGIEHILQIIRVDYVLGYGPQHAFNQGFLIGLGLEF